MSLILFSLFSLSGTLFCCHFLHRGILIVTMFLLFSDSDDHIGPARLPRFEDKPKMPFTEAFLYEVFRHTSYVPFTIPHWWGSDNSHSNNLQYLHLHGACLLACSGQSVISEKVDIYIVFFPRAFLPLSTTQNITLNGYFIPKDTCVFINQYQVNHDMWVLSVCVLKHTSQFMLHFSPLCRVGEVTLKVKLAKLPITSEWKRLSYSKATLKKHIVYLTEVTLEK